MQIISKDKIPKLILIVFLSILIVIAAIPGYLKLKWEWMELPKITNLKQIKNLGQTGLTLNNWQVVEKNTKRINNSQWLVQKFQQKETELTLMILTQKDHTKQPEVEWMDIIGNQRWLTDSYKNLNFTVDKSQVSSRFFRAWNNSETFAVLQWYAWKTGGDSAAANWFFADQMIQWQKHRLPWVAVNLQIKIEPLGDIETVRSLAESIAKEVQLKLSQVL
jgi:cyanoexosortase B-associated protein